MNRIFLGSALDALADAVPQMGVEDDERKTVQRAVCQACEKRHPYPDFFGMNYPENAPTPWKHWPEKVFRPPENGP